jgi:hypothetical protein
MKEKGNRMKNQITWLALRSQRVVQACRAKRSFAIHSITLLLFLAAGTVQALAQQLDGGLPGPYPVGHTSFVIKAQDRDRLIAVDVFYPADAARIGVSSPEAVYAAFPYEKTSPLMKSSEWEALGYDRAFESPVAAKGPFPLVVFSTGLGTPGWGYLYFGTRLASHGFVVAINDAFRSVVWAPGMALEWPSQQYHARPRDMSDALTEMLRRNAAKGDALYRLLDPRFVVASGHSAGGYAGLVQFSGDDQLCDAAEFLRVGEKNPPNSVCEATPTDSRFTALLTLDAAAQMLHWEEMARIRVPSLIMGQAYMADGAQSQINPGFESFVARPHAAVCTQSRSVRVDVRLADHFSFGDTCDGLTILLANGVISSSTFSELLPWYLPGSYGMTVGPIREGHRLMTKYAVAWLRAEVVKDGDALSRNILTQAYAKTKEPNVEVYWNEDCNPGGVLPDDWFSYFTEMTPGACAIAPKDPPAYFIPYP